MRLESKAPSLYTELFQRHPANPILTARDWPFGSALSGALIAIMMLMLTGQALASNWARRVHD